METKATGGWIRLVVWSAAIQSALGFSMCFMAIGAGVLWMFAHPPWLISFMISLWYVVAVPLLLGTGLIITIHSWQMWWRERDLLDLGVSVYNTMTMMHNIASAMEGMGQAFGGIADGLGKMFGSDSDEDGALGLLAILVVICSLLAGVLLTVTLIKRYAGTVPLPVRQPEHRLA